MGIDRRRKINADELARDGIPECQHFLETTGR